MVEETPSNLTGLGANFLFGRGAGGNRRLDQSIDRLERVIGDLSSNIQRLTGSVGAQSKGQAATGGSQQAASSAGNGGNWSGAHAPQSHRAEGEPRWTTFGTDAGGERKNNGGGVTFGGMPPGGAGGGGGGVHSSGWSGAAGAAAGRAYAGMGGRAGIARKALGATGFGIGVYTANHFDSQTMEQSLASQNAYGSNWSTAYRGMFSNNYTAVNDTDRVKAASVIMRTTGAAPGSAAYGAQRSSAESLSYANPAISNTQAATANQALAAPGTFTRMRALGIQTTNRRGVTDVWSIAHQIIQKIPGSQNIKTEANLRAAFAPTGSVTMTIQGMVQNGYIPTESAGAVTEATRSILRAQIQGESYTSLRSDLHAASGSANTSRADSARDRLSGLGLGNSLIQRSRTKAGLSHQTETETIEGFTEGLKETTDTLQNFRSALNKILDGPLGTALGASSGVTGGLAGVASKIPIIGGLFSHISGAANSVGGMAPTMSQPGYSARSFGMGSMMSANQSGIGAYGGTATARQSGGSSSGGSQTMTATSGGGSGGGGSQGHAGIRFIAPRPGINSMSSEQDFGPRKIGQGFHTGVDLQGGVGAPIKASADGTVTGAGWGASGDGGYGNTVMITHGGGYVTMYAHMSHISVHRGQRVRQGQIIGGVGATGSYARGAHLHFEIHLHGKPVDPKPYIGGGKRANVGGGAGSGGSNTGPSTIAGGTSDNAAGTAGASMGSTGSFASGGGGGGSGDGGAYSEVAALNLGGVGMAGGGGGSQPDSSADPNGGSIGSGGISGAGAGGTVRTGTYNVLWQSPASGTKEALARLTKSADILGLQEFEGPKVRGGHIPDWLNKRGWGYYKAGHADAVLTWNKSKYDLIRKGGYRLNKTQGAWGGDRQRFASYGLFRDKKTGAEHWEISSHFVPGSRPHSGLNPGLATRIIAEQFQSLGRLTKQLERSAPVIAVGDYNQTTHGPNSGHWNYGALNGLRSNWDGKKGYHIDQTLADPRVARLLATRMASGGSSDHDAVLSTYALKGAGGGGGRARRGAVLHGDKYRVGGGVEQWRNEVIAAMQQQGRTHPGRAVVNQTLMQMRTESGGNPYAVNHWDSNARAGHPSVGLMQVIRGTFAAHAQQYRNVGPFAYGVSEDGMANIYAGLHYAKARYGSWENAFKGHGYAKGAWSLPNDELANVHKGEMIIPEKIAGAVRSALTAPHRGTGMMVTFQPGSIAVSLSGPVTQSDAFTAGRQIVDAVLEDSRMKALAEGRL